MHLHRRPLRRAAAVTTALAVGLVGVTAASSVAAASPSARGFSTPFGPGARAAAPAPFVTLGDRVHVSSTPPPTLSAHGWWVRVSGPATLAKVTVRIQQHWGGWVNVGSVGVRTVRSGGGAGNRATARARCHRYRGRTYTYRSVVDADIVGYNDTAEKLRTRLVTTSCSYLGRDRL